MEQNKEFLFGDYDYQKVASGSSAMMQPLFKEYISSGNIATTLLLGIWIKSTLNLYPKRHKWYRELKAHYESRRVDHELKFVNEVHLERMDWLEKLCKTNNSLRNLYMNAERGPLPD